METPLITTIIPTFRRPKLLTRALRSALDQSFTHIAVSVCDNASGDETSEVVNEIRLRDPRVMYHVQQRNIGAAANFAFGLERVATPFFSFLSDDDLLLPEFYNLAMHNLEKYPEAAFFAGAVICMSSEGQVLYAPMTHWEREGLFTPAEGFVNSVGPSYLIWTGIVFRTAVVRQCGGLDTSCCSATDIEFVARIAAQFPFVVSKAPCAICVSHPGSSSWLPRLHDIWPGWRKMMQKVSDNAYLPAATKGEALNKLSRDIANIASSLSVQATAVSRFFLSRRACVVLRKSGHVRRARLFATVNWTAQFSPVVRYTVNLTLQLRQKLRKTLGLRNAFLSKEFGPLAEHLKK